MGAIINIIYTIILITFAFFTSLECRALDGAWRGELDIMQTKLPLVFNFAKNSDGTVSCNIDSPMQGVKGVTSDVTYCSGDSIAISINSIGASYQGKILPTEIRGTFLQRGMSFPLILTKESSLEERRPQTPKAPFPYTSTDTTFSSADGVVLAGTYTLPHTPANGAPLVVMITGSGPQNRDEEMLDHKPFAVIADWLARNGIASFRYDDRGTAGSQGDFKSADIDTFKADAAAALSFAKTLNPKGKTGLLGHSEGGTIALMLAAEGTPDFVVSLAAATVKGKDIILAQNAKLLEKLQLDEKQTRDALRLISLAFDDIISGKNDSEIPLDKYIADQGLDINQFVLTSLRQNLAASTGNYFRQLLSLDPSIWMGNIKCKVMAANGTFDTQVSCNENLNVVRKSIPNATVKEYQGLNHMFQHATTGEMTEYINIRETISPEVLSDIVSFILE